MMDREERRVAGFAKQGAGSTIRGSDWVRPLFESVTNQFFRA